MDREPSVSDDDDDLETLVPQNHTKPPSPSSRSRVPFAITALRPALPSSAASLGRRLWSRRYLLICISLPVLFIVLFFSLGGASSLPASIRLPSASSAADPAASRMREAELHALYLLRSQRSGLLSLFNRTATNTSTPTPVSLSDLQAALLTQIKLNREIQEALLSTHHSGVPNTTNDGAPDLDLPGPGCRRKDLPYNRRTIEWSPKKNRYLFAICLSGQMSNHLICLEKHMFFAALLGRTLVVPSQKVDYQYDKVLDIENINNCIGKKVVITYEEFAETRKKVSIDQFICYVASPPCYMDEDHIKKLKDRLGISMGKIEAAWPEDAKLKEPKKRYVADITPKFTTDAEVLAIGEMFSADAEEEWLMQPGGPLAHKCRTLIQPSKIIMLTAQRFVQTFLGGNYIALHFRRHGFLKFCNVKKESCFFPIPQAAECILRIVEKANAPLIYLSTDAAESETNLLQSLVVFNDRQVPLVKRPEHHSSEKWDALLYRDHMGGDNQVEAMLDKTICALSNVFIGTSGSTFTEDIFRLRRGWGSMSYCDEYLCQGELPNYIAEQD
ncbi:hypothetical protein QYE76_040149 [Lolium multiflorum]|uniref:GDP-fucose protein O-fucosyltransferase 2 n=1 Tax=Lolium multiflorum TaxID=4521 RepID=A0AAD8TCV4_LOLMU|nr:hypothetical protein QYE76_040149 [Lolium multiflorum]